MRGWLRLPALRLGDYPNGPPARTAPLRCRLDHPVRDDEPERSREVRDRDVPARPARGRQDRDTADAALRVSDPSSWLRSPLGCATWIGIWRRSPVRRTRLVARGEHDAPMTRRVPGCQDHPDTRAHLMIVGLESTASRRPRGHLRASAPRSFARPASSRSAPSRPRAAWYRAFGNRGRPAAAHGPPA